MAATLLWALDRYAGKKSAKNWHFWWGSDPDSKVCFEAAFGWLSIFLILGAAVILSYFPLSALGVQLLPVSWIPVFLLSMAVSGFSVNMAIHLLAKDARPSIVGDVLILLISVASAAAVGIRLAF